MDKSIGQVYDESEDTKRYHSERIDQVWDRAHPRRKIHERRENDKVLWRRRKVMQQRCQVISEPPCPKRCTIGDLAK